MNARSKGILLVLSMLGLLLGAWGVKAFPAQPDMRPGNRPGAPALTPQVRQAVRTDVSRPIREIPARITRSNQPEDNENPPIFHPTGGPAGLDTAIQKVLGPLVMPTPIANFDGEYNQYGPIPPDTNGDVGRNHYVQTVNSGFTVFNKTGTILYGPSNINTLFTGFGGLCELTNQGDPVVLYDPLADRWLITQFAYQPDNTTHQCIALSTGPDPTGSYYRYDFLSSSVAGQFEDYPHLGVWPDAYYMSTNEFYVNGGGGNFAFNRAKMLRGDATAELIYFHTPNDAGMQPTDLDGAPPPVGTPNFFWELYNSLPGQLAQFRFHADFATPANSTFTGPIIISVADFDFNAPRVPQPGTTITLDSISDRVMFRAAYRNFGAYESVVFNHTVNASGLAAPRWYEIRSPNATPTVFQQGTYAPADSIHRWMGSIAQDKAGDIAIGFSAGNANLFPSIRYAGRVPGDPPGVLGQGEAILFNGTGSETLSGRWGDYSDMTVDPVDECTFWYTTEYFAQTGQRNWRTRIGSFRFPNCVTGGSPTPVASATGGVPTATPVRPTITPCAGYATYSGTLDATDPTQTGRLAIGGPNSRCGVPSACPAISTDTTPKRYDMYSYTNSTGSTQCVTVNVLQNCGDNAMQSVAYLGTFDPANLCANYLADGGTGGHTFSYSFSLPAGQTAQIIAVEVSSNLGCASYTLSINPCLQGTSTPTPPLVTSTPTPIQSPSPTPTIVCVGTTYQVFPSAGATMIPATNDIGNHCDDCTTNITLPFAVPVYGTPYTAVNVGSNGDLLFASTNPNIYTANCPPVQSNAPPLNSVLFAYYDDLRTDVLTGTHGIYTAVVGSAPNRDFVIRWQTTYFADDAVDANFEVVLHENSPTLSVIYGQTGTTAQGANPGTGIQFNLGQYTRYMCGTEIPTGTRVDYVPIGCGVTPSPTVAPPTATPTQTTTPCPLPYTDVNQYNPFYVYIRCLYCRGALQGYGTTFGPYVPITRAEVAKIVTLAAQFPIDTTGGPHFTDVPTGHPFYPYIETLYNRGVLNGYDTPASCPSGIPCFLPDNQVTRGQLAKIDSNAAGFTDMPPANSQSFADVPPNSVFWLYIQRLARRGIISGYDCNSGQLNCATGQLETCGPGNLPYYRPCNNITRGQTAKIVANSFYPVDCAPGRIQPPTTP